MPTATSAKLLVIGGGNMGSAIVLGALRNGTLATTNVLVAEPDAAKREGLTSQSLSCTPTATEGLAWATTHDAVVLLAIKPQMLPILAADCQSFFAGQSRTIISILAGTPVSKLATLLGPHHRFIRAMPNLPASIGMGTTAICIPGGTSYASDIFAQSLFAAIGPNVLPLDESLFDAFTATAGSGPAYFFYLAQSIQQAAIAQGFDPETAATITRSTLLGSAIMFAQTNEDAATLRQRVTSKGGTTEAAINVLDSNGVAESILKAIDAATSRAGELAQ